MKKIINFLVLLMLFVFPLQVSAQRDTRAQQSSIDLGVINAVGESQASVSFAELGFTDSNLVSPFDSTRVFFSLPPNLQLADGGEIVLNFDVVMSGAGSTVSDGLATPYGGLLTVTFNNQILDTVRLEQSGSQSLTLKISPSALQSVRADGRHQLLIALDAQLSCSIDTRTLVTIKSTSLFNLNIKVSAPELNLARLPAPFYLRNSLLPDQTFVALPDDPSASELQAALNVMVGFGAMIGRQYAIQLTNIGALTSEELASSNVIFVGKPANFPQLNKAEFPLKIADGKFVNMPDASTQDGVIELAVSPWNDGKVVMLVSGNSDQAVGMAAHAVSSGSIFVYETPTLSYVKNVQLFSDAVPLVQDFTLESLGYADATIRGIGLNSVDYVFKVSKEQLASQDDVINFVYYHSGLLDYSNSSFSIEVNGQVIVSTALNKDSEQLTTSQVKIPPGLLRFGENHLTVNSRMLANISCDISGFSDPWLTISAQTSLHLPASELNPVSSVLDLKLFLNLLTAHSELGDIAFVLPKNSPSSWSVAGSIAYDLGQIATPLISNLEAAYADDVPQEIRSSNSLVVVGRASALPLMVEINANLPAPFDLATDNANEQQMQIIYRIPPGVNVGYLELAASPFNPEQAMLIVAGNTDDGVNLAGNTLVTPTLRDQLSGLFAVTNGTQVATANANSIFSVVGEVVPGAAQVIATPIVISPSTQPRLERPVWLLPIIILSSLAGLVLVGMSVRASRKQLMKPSNGQVEDEPHQDDESG